MLTVKQSSTVYGYKSVHDLPTPPSTSRPSPPLSYHDPSFMSQVVSSSTSRSPLTQPMSASHRGLPPPAAMTLSQQPPSAVPPSRPPSHHGQPPQPPQQQQQQQPPPPPALAHAPHQPPHPWNVAPLPPPPQQWQGSGESMKAWLQAKTEEERTKQEEEKTRQESLRLEQRRVEMDILRASLGGGIPPPLVPLVFAGMGNGGSMLPQAAFEWAQQFMAHAQGHHPQLPPPPRPASPEHPRDTGAPSHAVYPPVAAQPAPAQAPVPIPAPSGYAQFPTSPPSRPRGQTMPGVLGRPMGPAPGLTGLNPNPQQASHGVAIPPYQGHGHGHPPTHPHPPTQSQSAQNETNPSIYFHHWQPPTAHGGGGGSGSGSGSGGPNRPGTPSGDAQRKRKVSGASTQQPTRAPSEERFRSPPPFSRSGPSNHSPGRRSHKRQRSEVPWYKAMAEAYRMDRRDRQDPGELTRAKTPPQVPAWGQPAREREEGKSGKHSVSSLLSGDPEVKPPMVRYPSPQRGSGSTDPHENERAGEKPLPLTDSESKGET